MGEWTAGASAILGIADVDFHLECPSIMEKTITLHIHVNYPYQTTNSQTDEKYNYREYCVIEENFQGGNFYC